MKNLLLASTSTLHGQEYLEYLLPELSQLWQHAKTVTFIPYARPGGISHDDYTETARKALKKIGKNVIGLHESQDPIDALNKAEAIFCGGGNTFLLVKQLYENKIMAVLREHLQGGCPYLGTSAGSNIAGQTMGTTNDMPIVLPPSFNTLGLVPFNLNPHYLDPDPQSTHKGETRETRLREFLVHNNIPVVGLREGSSIRVTGKKMALLGPHTARIFEVDKPTYEVTELPF